MNSKFFSWFGVLVLSLSMNSLEAKKLNFIATGDAPYRMPEDEKKFIKLKNRIEKLKPDFVIHVGDIKSGGDRCTDERIRLMYNHFQGFSMPLIYTPGDNEWTDCHRSVVAPNNPLERLSFIRKLFFSKPQSLGKKTFSVESQKSVKGYSEFVENLWFKKNDVHFVTLHVVGSNNNRHVDSHTAFEEYKKRNQANIYWLRRAFKRARKEKAKALVLIQHADMFLKKEIFERTGFDTYIQELENQVSKISIPVLLIHGDQHRLTIDHPFRTGKWDGPMENFTRLQVYGAPMVSGVEVTIDTSQPQPFYFHGMGVIQ